MIKAVIFDFDGVIADSAAIGFEATNNILEIFEKPKATLKEFKEEFGADRAKFYRNRGVSEEQIEKEPGLFKKEFEVLKNEIKMFAGIDSVIGQLAKKYRLGIVSNNHWEFIVEFLKKFGIHSHFDSIIGYIHETRKPDTKQLFMCLEELGVKPEEACVIGDTIDEITMSRNAGVAKIIAVSYGYDPLHKLEGADVVIHNPEEILKALEAL